jgi:hypothetical protein
MMRIGRWLSSKIDTYISGIIESRVNEKIQAMLYGSSGDDSPPLEEDRVLMIQIDGSGKYSIAGVLSKSQGANPGEKILYSRNSSGVKQATIYLKGDKSIIINAGTKNAARKDDTVSSSIADDSIFWTWLSAAAIVLTGLGVVAPTPTSLASKITGGSSEVKLP